MSEVVTIVYIIRENSFLLYACAPTDYYLESKYALGQFKSARVSEDALTRVGYGKQVRGLKVPSYSDFTGRRVKRAFMKKELLESLIKEG